MLSAGDFPPHAPYLTKQGNAIYPGYSFVCTSKMLRSYPLHLVNMANLLQFLVLPEAIQDRSSVESLKNRLDWGEPALTIVDVRDRNAFNTSHIMGAIAIPMQELVTQARGSLELIRDIYVYGETEKETAEAASQLREAGYQHIAELVGGLAAWRRAEYPIDGFSVAIG
jgi:rhodanese-related sulfurtransferase